MKRLNLCLVLVICVSFLIREASTQQHTIPHSVFGSGGKRSSNANYQLIGTLGQPLVGKTSSLDQIKNLGFWRMFGPLVVNHPPVISPLPVLFFNEDDTLIYQISDWFPYVEDPNTPDEQLSYFVMSGSNITAGPGNAVFFFYATENWFGSDTLQLVVSDGILSDTAALYANVIPVNDPPTILHNFPNPIQFLSDTTYVFNLDTVVADTDDAVEALHWEVFDTSFVTVQIDPVSHQCLISYSQMENVVGDTIYFAVTDTSFASDTTEGIIVNVTIVDIDELSELTPNVYSLDQNYPNPFNPVTHIRFGLPRPSKVKIEVFNVLGEKILTLLDANKPAGYHTTNLDGSQLASGIYLYRMHVADFVEVRKMVLLR